MAKPTYTKMISAELLKMRMFILLCLYLYGTIKNVEVPVAN